MLRKLLVSVARGSAVAIALPLLLTHQVYSLISTRDHSLETHSEILSLIPGKIGNYLRVGFYRFTLKHCHPTATICFGTLLSKTETRIEQHVYIGPRCMLGSVDIGKNTLLGPAVQIPSGPNTHGFSRTDIPIREQAGQPRTIKVGEDCWVGAGAIILSDLQHQNVVGANSVVTKIFECKSIIAGAPAKFIRSRDEIASRNSKCD